MKLRTEKEEFCVEQGDAKFYGHPLTPKETTEFMNKATKKEWDRGQRFTDVDIYKFKIMKIHKVIRRWEGITDAKGITLECTIANRELVYLYNPAEIDKVLDKFDEIVRPLEEEEAYSEKNLESGSPGQHDLEP